MCDTMYSVATRIKYRDATGVVIVSLLAFVKSPFYTVGSGTSQCLDFRCSQEEVGYV